MAWFEGIRSSDRFWTGVALAATTLAAVGLRKGLKQGWRELEGKDPPMDPAASDVSWREALLWAVMAGAAGGVGRVLARRGASYLQDRVGA